MAAGSRRALLLLVLCAGTFAKLSENKTNFNLEGKSLHRVGVNTSTGATVLLAEEIKQLLERYLFGICPSPQGYKSQFANRGKQNETSSCDLDGQLDLAGRLASLSIRAQMSGRGDCPRALGGLASVFAELARAAVHHGGAGGPSSEAAKKRKLSKSQKAKLQAKQRTALAVKKKAAAAAAATAAKMAS